MFKKDFTCQYIEKSAEDGRTSDSQASGADDVELNVTSASGSRCSRSMNEDTVSGMLCGSTINTSPAS